MPTGKLYTANDEQFVAGINYQFQNESRLSWWGELTFINYTRIDDRASFIIELEDQRKGRCYLKKRVNRAVSGIPPRYTYRFSGTSALE